MSQECREKAEKRTALGYRLAGDSSNLQTSFSLRLFRGLTYSYVADFKPMARRPAIRRARAVPV